MFIRRLIGFLSFGALQVGIFYFILPYHYGIRHELFQRPWETFGYILALLAGVALLIHSMAWPKRFITAVLCVLLGVLAVVVGQDVFSGINWTGLGWLVGYLVVSMILLIVTCTDVSLPFIG
jgi:hypothetical protein